VAVHVLIWHDHRHISSTLPLPSAYKMPEFDLRKVYRRLKRSKTPRGTTHPTSSGQDTVRNSVDSGGGGHPTSESAIVLLDIASSISRATDLRDPLNSMSEALMKVLDTAKVSHLSMQQFLFCAETRIECRFIEGKLECAPQETSIPP
jgi:hypothetical protein